MVYLDESKTRCHFGKAFLNGTLLLPASKPIYSLSDDISWSFIFFQQRDHVTWVIYWHNTYLGGLNVFHGVTRLVESLCWKWQSSLNTNVFRFELSNLCYSKYTEAECCGGLKGALHNANIFTKRTTVCRLCCWHWCIKLYGRTHCTKQKLASSLETQNFRPWMEILSWVYITVFNTFWCNARLIYFVEIAQYKSLITIVFIITCFRLWKPPL